MGWAAPIATTAAASTAAGTVVPSILVSTGPAAGGLLSGAAATMSAGAFASSLTSFTPLIATTQSAGLLGGLGSAFDVLGGVYNTVKPYMGLVSAGSSLLQGINAYQQGKAMQSQYRMQNLQIAAQNETMKLNAIQEATEKARRLLAINSTVFASGYAGGVNSLDGSVKLVMGKNAEEFTRDLNTLEYNKTTSNNFATAQQALLTTAANTAMNGSKVEALGYVGNAFKLYDETRVG